MALTALQQQILRVVAAIDDTATFALAGGGAMNVHHVSDRITHDLDLFTPDVERVATIAARLTAALEADGMNATRIRDTSGFIRLDVRNSDERTIIELAHDYRWLDPVQTTLGLVLDPRELAADKMCALFGRAETRDVLDIAQLRERFTLDEIVQWATEKDGGFDIGVTVDMVVAMTPDLSAFDITDQEFQTIRTQLVSDLVRLRRTTSRPQTRGGSPEGHQRD